jgi:hypothetical protein
MTYNYFAITAGPKIKSIFKCQNSNSLNEMSNHINNWLERIIDPVYYDESNLPNEISNCLDELRELAKLRIHLEQVNLFMSNFTKKSFFDFTKKIISIRKLTDSLIEDQTGIKFMEQFKNYFTDNSQAILQGGYLDPQIRFDDYLKYLIKNKIDFDNLTSNEVVNEFLDEKYKTINEKFMIGFIKVISDSVVVSNIEKTSETELQPNSTIAVKPKIG